MGYPYPNVCLCVFFGALIEAPDHHVQGLRAFKAVL